MADQNLRVNLLGDSSQLNAALTKASSKLQNFSANVGRIGQSLTTRLTLPLAVAGGAAFKMAADFDESMNKVQVSFKDASGSVVDFSKTALSRLGISQAQALETAALFGDMATGMGSTTKEAAAMATSLTSLSADLASFKNIQQSVAQTALASVFTGETESLKKLGIVMTETNLAEFARQQGIKKTIKDMTQLEKVQLRFSFVMSKTKNAQGDFARTSQSASNQLRTLQNTLIELGTKIGQILLPPITKVIQKITSLLNNFIALDSETKKQIITFGVLAASLGPVLLVISGIAKAIALLTSPIALVVAGIAALGAGFLYLRDNWNAVKERLSDWSWWQNTIISMLQFFVENNPFNLLINGINAVLKFAGAQEIENPFHKFSNEYLEELKTTTKDYENEFGSFGDTVRNQISPIIDKIKEFGDTLGLGGSGETRDPVQALGAISTGLKTATGELYKFGIVAAEVTGDTLNNLLKPIATEFQSLGDQLIPQVGQALTDSFAAIAQGENPLKRLETTIKALVVRLLAAAAAAALLSFFLGGPGGKIGTFKGFSGMFEGFSGGIKLANGGIVTGPTMALIGEYPGARSNPEVVAPLNKLQSLIDKRGGNMQGQFILRGQDLVLALQKANKNRNRFM